MSGPVRIHFRTFGEAFVSGIVDMTPQGRFVTQDHDKDWSPDWHLREFADGEGLFKAHRSGNFEQSCSSDVDLLCGDDHLGYGYPLESTYLEIACLSSPGVVGLPGGRTVITLAELEGKGSRFITGATPAAGEGRAHAYFREFRSGDFPLFSGYLELQPDEWSFSNFDVVYSRTPRGHRVIQEINYVNRSRDNEPHSMVEWDFLPPGPTPDVKQVFPEYSPDDACAVSHDGCIVVDGSALEDGADIRHILELLEP